MQLTSLLGTYAHYLWAESTEAGVREDYLPLLDSEPSVRFGAGCKFAYGQLGFTEFLVSTLIIPR